MKRLRTITLVALACIAFTNCYAVDTNQLSTIILNTLTNSFPGLASQLSGFGGYIAEQAGWTTNFNTLNSQLITTFSNDPAVAFLSWQTNGPTLTVDAAQIAWEAFPSPYVKPITPFPILAPADPSSNSWGMVTLWVGEKLLNAYSITNTSTAGKPSGKLNPNNTSAQPFIEVDFNERYVMRSGQEYNESPWETDPADSSLLRNPFGQIPDVNFSFGYVFGPGTGTNQLSISTIVGSSDIYADESVGLPILRYHNQDFSNKQQVTLEISGGFATDKDFDVVHPTVFLGGGYQAKFSDPLTATNSLPIYWFGRLGLAMIDEPQLTSSNVVFKSSGGIPSPVFQSKWVPSMGATVIVPVNQTLRLQLGGNVYFGSGPEDWNITLGVSADLGKFASGLGSLFGL
jgi:hypothetical protein